MFSKMIGKQNEEDEIPLTVSKSTILQETKARFDSLLKAAHSQDVVQKMDVKKVKKISSTCNSLKDIKVIKKRSNWELSSSSQKLVSDDDHSLSEQDLQEFSQQVPPNATPEEVNNAFLITSSDESLNSPHKGETRTTNDKKINGLFQSENYPRDTLASNNSLERPIPLPRKRQSTRDESRETTSSRVSSPDSVMTAIEAASPVRSHKSSSSDQVSHRNLNDCDKSLNDKETENYELKPLQGLSPSYEEIDETNLDMNKFNHRQMKHTTVKQSLIGMVNAASYEEILDNEHDRSDLLHGEHLSHESHDSESINDSSSQQLHHEKRRRHNKKIKLRMSSQRSKPRGETIDSDSSSNNAINMGLKESRIDIARREVSSTEQDIKSHTDVNYTYEKIVGVSLHRCDTLKIDSLIRHPMVRVHIFDSTTGEYLKKSQLSRNVSYFQESLSIDYIQPLTCHPCNFKDPRSLTPIWGETLLFNEDITHILHPSIIFLFEIVDCVSFDTAVARYQKLGPESGWHRIAWAFLKPKGPNNIVNVDRRLRLQLYQPRVDKSFIHQSYSDKCDVYQWWSKGGWIQYPSTLHVTVHSLPFPSNVSPALRSYFALQPEQFSLDTDIPDSDFKNVVQNSARTSSSSSSLANDVVWSRLPMQSCKVPNNQELNLSAGLNGSFSVKFSHQGRHLAITAATQNMHNLCIYKIPSGVEMVRFQGHPGLVYSLDWSPNDELLLSASADCTACIWSVKSQTQLQMLPHPSFVYCALFVPGNSLSLATGCCDHVIRVWRQSNQTTDFELHQELVGHEGYVSTLCVNASGLLFSGDSVGQIRIWQSKESFWNPLRALSNRELQGIVLNHLLPHPGGKRLLVLARDSLIRMIDISTGVAIQWFKGALNHRIHSNASISPCGGLVFSPSEDGTFHVWNADTGQLIASYSSLFHSLHKLNSNERQSLKTQKSTAILSGAIDYHPFEHMVAFAVYGAHTPVIICNYTRNSSGKDLGLHFVHEDSDSKMDHMAESIPALSNPKPQFQFDRNSTEQNLDFVNNLPLTLMSSYKGIDTNEPKEEKHQLSYVIRQLDYVLQLSRMSKEKQNQLLNITQGSTSDPSHLSVVDSSSPNFFEIKNNASSAISKGEGNEVNYSMPQSFTELQKKQQLDLIHCDQSDKEDGSCQIPVSQSVQLHYVQEKQRFGPRPSKRRLKPAKAGRVKSLADLSTTDTSLLSSENEVLDIWTK